MRCAEVVEGVHSSYELLTKCLNETYRLKRTTKQFFDRGMNSLLLSIELFNRPYERGRAEIVFITLDHAFEMLMKSIIYAKTGKIRGRREKYNYGFEKCVNILKDTLHVINENQAMTLNIINDLRDCVMHHIVTLSEESLYFHSQTGVTLYDDLLRAQFDKPLRDCLPERVLPISTNPPSNIDVFFDKEFSQVEELIAPGKRHKTEAIARLRPLIILESNITGKEMPTSDYGVNNIVRGLKIGKSWKEIFPGIVSLRMDSTGTGLTYSLRLTKKEGLLVRPISEGEDASKAIAYKEVNLLDRYSLNITNMAEKIGITRPKANALVEYLKIQGNTKFFKDFVIDTHHYKRYSPEVLSYLQEKLKEIDINAAWEEYFKKHYHKD